jgi:hypothetical protein
MSCFTLLLVLGSEVTVVCSKGIVFVVDCFMMDSDDMIDCLIVVSSGKSMKSKYM